MLSDALDIYLNDHLAVLVAERELCQRMEQENEQTPLAGYLQEHRGLCEEGERIVRDLLKSRGANASSLKTTAAWLAEKLGRLKLNGQITGYAPASRVLELEGLTVATQARLMLWRCLSASGVTFAGEPSPDWDELCDQADRQLAELRALQSAAAADAFGDA
ncbi:hypothetical protein Pla123a_20240 [Posidoniimonas polymericola]|uniref:DUF892 family protein n=1 Tax=Posidoniimonas polymericola TaxID=2528002 RepID=A0A5C5YR67_9BACT|nr:hypothetical protein [Posidoniimonas polymericola]TWT77363.1 hypothetical protein Pla123a_20240 [Posidoniimonas polymericola]